MKPTTTTNAKQERYYVGRHKPAIEVDVQPPDPYYWDRVRAAKRLNREPESLNDEPDFDTRLDMEYE